VLLRNADDLLPLDTSRVRTLAVVGPNADRAQFGDGSPAPREGDGVSVLQGLRNLLGNSVRLVHAAGCEHTGTSTGGFGEAVAVARRGDAVVAVLGDEGAAAAAGRRDTSGASSPTCGAGYDAANPVLPGVQLDLVKAVAATGKPVIVVLLHGRPYSEPWLKENAGAILSVFFAGEAAGDAVAEILFGAREPGGRLPVSVARGAGNLPTTYDHTPSARGIYRRPGSPEFPGRDYVFEEAGPLWPFGFGLGYARFQYSDLVVETPEVTPGDEVRLRFLITNLSARDGADIAQVYFHNATSLVSGPARRLACFAKFTVAAGATLEARMSFHASALAEWDRLVRSRVAGAGDYEILIGASAEDISLRGRVVMRNAPVPAGTGGGAASPTPVQPPKTQP